MKIKIQQQICKYRTLVDNINYMFSYLLEKKQFNLDFTYWSTSSHNACQKCYVIFDLFVSIQMYNKSDSPNKLDLQTF